MKFKVTLLLLIFISAAVWSQDSPRWYDNPNMPVYPTGVYVELPQETFPVYNPSPGFMRIIQTPTEVLLVNPSVRPHPSNLSQQCEVYITRNPLNPNILLVCNQPIRNTNNYINAGCYVSIDGGVTWLYGDTLNTPIQADQRGDPGPAIDKNGVMIYTHLTSNTNFGGLRGMGANYSSNGGANWSATFDIMVNSNVDKNLACSDDASASPYYGNSYMAYTVFAGVAGNGRFSRTTDGGVTWSVPIILNTTPASHFAQGHDCKVGPTGNVYVVWTAGSSTPPYTEDFVGFAKSIDGGVTFTPTENAYDVNGSRSASYNGWAIRTNGFPRIDVDKTGGSRNGWIYIVTSEFNLPPAGTDADIVLHRSTDAGATWSAGIKVNQDALNNGKVQFFPAVRVDQGGGVNVTYYDNRDFPSVGDSCSVYLSRSTDGGTTWTDVEVADHHFRPKLLPGINTMGDYIGITSTANKIWVAWMDDKTGFAGTQFNIWVGYVSYTPVGITGNSEIPKYYGLSQNYPNPFNPSTKITYSVPKSGNVLISVFDMLGREAATLVNETKEAGIHSIDFNAANLSSGIYFYRIDAGSFTDVKKMMLIK